MIILRWIFTNGGSTYEQASPQWAFRTWKMYARYAVVSEPRFEPGQLHLSCTIFLIARIFWTSLKQWILRFSDYVIDCWTGRQHNPGNCTAGDDMQSYCWHAAESNQNSAKDRWNGSMCKCGQGRKAFVRVSSAIHDCTNFKVYRVPQNTTWRPQSFSNFPRPLYSYSSSCLQHVLFFFASEYLQNIGLDDA